MREVHKLVQRAVFLPEGRGQAQQFKPSGTPLDFWFTWQYMGNALFEFGALPDSLELMRAAHDEKPYFITKLMPPESSDLQVFPAWALTRRGEHSLAARFFEDQLSGNRWVLSERTFMKRLWGKRVPWSAPDTWWAIDAELPFVLSVHEMAVKRFLEVIAR